MSARASDTAAAVHAAERIRRFEERRPDAARLARFASLAVRVDASLLRALRLELMRAAGAEAEADLWFSPLVESFSSEGFVLHPQVAARLREALAGELTNGKQILLQQAARVVEAAHHDWPPSLKLEESIIHVSLARPGSEAERRAQSEAIEARLQEAVKAMSQDDARGLEVARWAQRALRSLPAAALDTDAALLLALGASERLKGNVALARPDQARALPDDVAWLLPGRKFSSHARLGVYRHIDGLELAEPAADSLTMELPLTTPLYVQVSWTEGTARVVRSVSFAGMRKFVPTPPNAAELRLRTLEGKEYELVDAPTGGLEESVDLRNACVSVELTAEEGAKIVSSGFFVGENLVCAARHAVSALQGPANVVVNWRGEVIPAEVVRAELDGELALLQLERAPDGAVVLPWETSTEPPQRGSQWRSAFRGTDLASGTVTGWERAAPLAPEGESIAMAGTTARLALLVEQPEGVQSAAPAFAGSSGAPVIVDGRVAGVVIAGDDRLLYAVGAVDVRESVLEAALQRTNRGTIFIADAAAQLPPNVLERARHKLRSMRFATVLESTLLAAAGDRAPVLDVASVADGGIVTAGYAAQQARGGALGLVYRSWADPDFPLVVLDASESHPNRPVLAKLGLVPWVRSVDDLERKFFDNARPADDGVAMEELTQIFARRDGPDVEVSHRVDTIMKLGVRAPDWPELVAGLTPRDRKRLADLALMFSFDEHHHRPMSATAAREPNAPRAFSINTMPIHVADALIRRAWIGREPPAFVRFRDQRWEDVGGADGIAKRVAQHVKEALSCRTAEALWLVEHSTAPYFLIFATRPLPPRRLIESVLNRLPGALLFFLSHEEHPAGLDDVLTELPRLGENEGFEFMSAYKRMMQAVAPREEPGQGTAPTLRARRATAKKRRSSPPAAKTKPRAASDAKSARPRIDPARKAASRKSSKRRVARKKR